MVRLLQNHTALTVVEASDKDPVEAGHVYVADTFNDVVKLVEGGDALVPCEKNVEAFIQWIHEHDLYQVPDTPTDFLRDQEDLNGDKAVSPVNDDLTLLPRKLVLRNFMCYRDDVPPLPWSRKASR